MLLRTETDPATTLVILGLWISSMSADLHITLSNGHLVQSHEQSVLLRYLHPRMPGGAAACLAVLAEASAVALFPVAFLSRFDMGASAAVAFLFAALHGTAILHNDSFVRS